MEVPQDLLRQRPELREEIGRLHRYANGAEIHPEWELEDLTEEYALYVGMVIDSRFRIKNPKTRSTIDLSFGTISDC